MNAPTFFIKTFGCQMNRDDSMEMSHLLRGLGFRELDSDDGADLVHINTCCVRQKAEDKFFSFLGRLRISKERTGSPAIGVSGCVPERADIKEKHQYLDYVIGSRHPADYLPEIAEVLQDRFPSISDVPAGYQQSPPFAYHTVMRGCSNFCSYCVVPYVRGPEISLPPEKIINAVEAKVRGGAREITLLGQNVLAYGYDLNPKRGLLNVIQGVHDIPGLERIRFVTSHPAWVHEEFLAGIAQLPRVCEHFHVPFQSGDDEILKRMNRGYTSAEYIEMIDLIRKYFPDAGITADAIVGYFGETTAHFENTLKLVEHVRPDNIYAFMYSVRPGTAVAEKGDDVSLEEKKLRLGQLNRLEDRISRGINEALIGQTLDIMAENPVAAGAHGHGRTRTSKLTDFVAAADHATGDSLRVRISGATPHGIQGEEVSG